MGRVGSVTAVLLKPGAVVAIQTEVSELRTTLYIRGDIVVASWMEDSTSHVSKVRYHMLAKNNHQPPPEAKRPQPGNNGPNISCVKGESVHRSCFSAWTHL